MKLQTLRAGLKQRPVYKFFAFLILQGLMMPQFPAFDYCFALDVLEIPLRTVNLQTLYVGWLVVFIPLIYQRFFIRRDFVVMFAIS